MSAGRSFECRFGVGDPRGRHSSVWKVWAARHTPDVYITSRMLGGDMKASIHASGQRHVGLTSTHISKATSTGAWSGGNRHFDRWEGGYDLGSGATLEYLLRFPTDHLRTFPLDEKQELASKWIPAAPPGCAMEIGLFFVPAGRAAEGGQNEPSELICHGRLVDARSMLLVARTVEMGTFTNEEHALENIRSGAREIGLTSDSVGPHHRVVFGFNVSEGVRGWVELALDQLL